MGRQQGRKERGAGRSTGENGESPVIVPEGLSGARERGSDTERGVRVGPRGGEGGGRECDGARWRGSDLLAHDGEHASARHPTKPEQGPPASVNLGLAELYLEQSASVVQSFLPQRQPSLLP